MECPKCKSIIEDDAAVCPHCHKVFLLECPNCHELGEDTVCSKCGYNILVKCSKCGKINPSNNQLCSKCGLPISTSIAYQECESDEFTTIIIKFNNLKKIRKQLKSKDLYSKFFYKLKNLLMANIKKVEGKLITYNDLFVFNFNKELSFPTSANKAIRLALKITNSLAELNLNIIQELNIPLGLNITLIKRSSEDLLICPKLNNNLKVLEVKKEKFQYLKGMQIVLDQYVCDEISKEYKTDSLYSTEENGKTLTFYEVLLSSYVLPQGHKDDDETIQVEELKTIKNHHNKIENKSETFNVFEISAKCKFINANALNFGRIFNDIPFSKGGNIISLRAKYENKADLADVIAICSMQAQKVVTVTCTPELNYKPWGIFESILKSYYNLAHQSEFSNFKDIGERDKQRFKSLFDLMYERSINAMSPEDARFAYMELWNKFFASLSNTTIILDGFENIDDTSIQTLELYFDKFKNIKPNFIFITNDQVSVHSKFKSLLRAKCYTEITLNPVDIEECLSSIKSDASDFISSFYYEKTEENFRGSYLYFKNAIEYLKETGVLVEFENKLIIKDSKSVILSPNLKTLYKSRMKNLGKNQNISFILAYSKMLTPMLDYKVLETLGVEDAQQCCKTLCESGLAIELSNGIYVNNYNIFAEIIQSSLKKEAEVFLTKNILAKIGKGLDSTTIATLMGKIEVYKDEYLTLWKNSNFAMSTGDYDAYLKNCLGFLALAEQLKNDIPKDKIEENKKEVYENILLCLYSYSPAKIYFIENILLMDAISQNDNEKIIKLSNLMLQGALISSNYTDALGLLHNILTRMKNPTLLVDGMVNTKFLLLSLVHIEILYNIGSYKNCVDTANDILSVLTPSIIDKVKPASFSTNLFVSHLLETMRLAALAKVYMLDDDFEKFFANIETAFGIELPEKDCILALNDFLANKVYSTGDIENASAFSKVIFLIMQEITNLNDNYKAFAQNIYQAKLLALDLHQREIELICDMLIAYAYFKIKSYEKASSIFENIISEAETSAIFNILCIAKYLYAKLKYKLSETESALLMINDSLALIRKHENQSKILFVLFENLYLDIIQNESMSSVDIETEEQKLLPYKDKLARCFI